MRPCPALGLSEFWTATIARGAAAARLAADPLGRAGLLARARGPRRGAAHAHDGGPAGARADAAAGAAPRRSGRAGRGAAGQGAARPPRASAVGGAEPGTARCPAAGAALGACGAGAGEERWKVGAGSAKPGSAQSSAGWAGAGRASTRARRNTSTEWNTVSRRESQPCFSSQGRFSARWNSQPSIASLVSVSSIVRAKLSGPLATPR